METPTITVKDSRGHIDVEYSYVSGNITDLLVTTAITGLVCFSLKHSLVNAIKKNLSLSRRISWAIAIPTSIAIGSSAIWGTLVYRKSKIRINTTLIASISLLASATGAIFCLRKIFGRGKQPWIRVTFLFGLPAATVGPIFIGNKILNREYDRAEDKVEYKFNSNGEKEYSYKILRLCSPLVRADDIYSKLTQSEWDAIKDKLWPWERWEAKRCLDPSISK